MAANGRLPASDLRAIPGGRLHKDVANSWLRLRQHIGSKAGVWICPTSARTAYRTYEEQVYFWNLYTSGRGALAARPGTSNHGWGTTVDVPTPTMARLINQHGAEHGWQKRWSDAPSEWWHFRYTPGQDRHKGQPAKPRPTGRRSLQPDERRQRDRLVNARAKAKRHGGWNKVPKAHQQAIAAKKWLKARRGGIERAAKRNGWERRNRRERHRYIGHLIGGGK